MRTEEENLDGLFPALKGLAALLDVLVDPMADSLSLLLLLYAACAVVGGLVWGRLEGLCEGVVCICGGEEGRGRHVLVACR